MSRDKWLYIGHMLDMSRKAIELSEGVTKTEYDSNETLRLALTHLVQMIGEAAQHVSNDLRKDFPQVPWHEIVGMRHRIVHDYLNVDEDVVWQVVSRDLPYLIKHIENILPDDYI